MNKFKDCDYFRTKDDMFFIARGHYHPRGRVRALPVFYPDLNGNRYHPLLRKYFSKYSSPDDIERMIERHPSYFYQGKCEKFLAVPLVEVAETYNPDQHFKQNKANLKNTIWGNIVEAIIETAGVSENDIGFFGSYLIGFEIDKDVDILIYGRENCRKIKHCFPGILRSLGCGSMSYEHNLKHVKKYSKMLNPCFTDFIKIGERRWSAIQVAPDKLTTIRFVYKKEEISNRPINSPPMKEVEIGGTVVDDFGTNFVPRIFRVKCNNNFFNIVSYLWSLQSCVKNGDFVKIRGALHQDNQTINIHKFEHGIKILNQYELKPEF